MTYRDTHCRHGDVPQTFGKFLHTIWADPGTISMRQQSHFLMEGEPEGLDVQSEDLPVVLWEKYIQQSIIVDLSEDESLHLSELESSVAFHISQAESAPSEASIHLSGCGELEDYDSSSESIVNSQSERHELNPSRSSVLCVSAQRPNTAVPDVPSQNLQNEDPGQDTSDEDHEELPYDGDLGHAYFTQAPPSDSHQTSSDGPDVLHFNEPMIIKEVSHKQPAPVEATMKAIKVMEEPATTKQDNDLDRPNQVSGNASFNLPQFVSKDELLRSGRLIEAETLPEVSLLESVDDTVFSRASGHIHPPHPCHHDLASISETNHSSCSEQKSNNVDLSLMEAKNNSSATDSSKHQHISGSGSEEAEEEEPTDHRAPLLRTASFTEMKYGQGQVHYPLPDFSKVAPKVRIPKTPKESSGLSTIHRAHSSPEMLDVVSRVLEDSGLTPERTCVFTEQDKPPSPALVQHLQAKYDKLLARYAEAENLIDQLRLGTNPVCESQLCFEDSQEYLPEETFAHPSDNMENKVLQDPPITNDKDTVSTLKPELGPSDGEIITTELSAIVTQFMQNVEEFKFNVSNRAINLEEQQMMLRSLMEAQDHLERQYMCKKEEHRALELQNYMGIGRNTGTFDPERLVEGGIFRVGMFLEDVKEMIDQNLCEQVSPPQSSSTLLPFDVLIQPNVSCMSPHSPPLSLHEDQSTSFSIEVPEERKPDATGACAGRVDDQVEPIITEPPKWTETISDHSRSSLTFPKGCVTPSAEDINTEDKEAVLGNETGDSDIQDFSCATGDIPEETLLSSLSLSVEDSCSSEASKDCEDAPKPSLCTSASQSADCRVNASVETDSGFGSSYFNQSTPGSSQQNINESFLSQHEPISSSESEGSCSHLQTAIEPVTVSRTQRPQPLSVPSEPPPTVHTNPAHKWVQSTTNEALGAVQDTKHLHMSEPLLSKMCSRDSPPYSCSCNNEAIVALQSEVSRLKRDVREGLVQLPVLTERLELLTSKHSSVKSPSIRLTSSPVKLDWISTDMSPSKSKAANNEDTTASEMQLDYSPIEGTRGSHFVFLDSGLYSPGPHLSSRALGERWSPLYSTPVQKPLLQVNYGSSSSLPASYKLRECPLQPPAYSRKISTQSDTALLPSNVFFQQTPSPLSAPSKLGGRISRNKEEDIQRILSPPSKLAGRSNRNKEEDIHHTLDQALEAARSMKKTTDRMAKSLSVDLAKAKIQRRMCRGRKHYAL